MRRSLFCLGLLLGLVGLGPATVVSRGEAPGEEGIECREYECRHLGQEPVVIDGKLDEDAWKNAAEMTGFSLLDKSDQPHYPTTARMLWDDKHLYVSFECNADAIRSRFTKRDEPIWEGDVAETFLCPNGPDGPYFEINISPHNVIFDCHLLTSDYATRAAHTMQWALDYNPALTTATAISRNPQDQVTGWSCELAIPFKELKLTPGVPATGDTWRFNVYRGVLTEDNKTLELQHWQKVTKDFHRPDQFARLIFTGPRE